MRSAGRRAVGLYRSLAEPGQQLVEAPCPLLDEAVSQLVILAGRRRIRLRRCRLDVAVTGLVVGATASVASSPLGHAAMMPRAAR